jgi:hypothetical protein
MHGKSTHPLVHLYKMILSPTNKTLQHTNNTREAQGKMVLTRHTPRPHILSTYPTTSHHTHNKDNNMLGLESTIKASDVSKCLKVLSSTPD